MVQSKKNADAGYWNYAQNFTYAASGAVASMQLGNGTWEKTQFNSRLQPTQIGLGTVQGGTDKLKLDYEYGELNPGTGQLNAGKNNGNLAIQVITVGAAGTSPAFTAQQNYVYDELNRLKTAAETLTPAGQPAQQWFQDFTYDRYGNRNFNESVTTTIPKNCANNTVCPEDRKIYNPGINAENNQLSTSDGYAFDNAGNTKADPQDRIFIYDAENKQVKVELIQQGLSPSTIAEYVYDGDGKRVKKIVNGSGLVPEVTIFVYDAAGKQIAEYSTNVAEPDGAAVAYLTNDHLGSPRINTDRDGNVTSRHDYHPFGEEIGTLANGSPARAAHPDYTPDSVRQQFTGYERDSESDLDFAQARMYNSRHGRFTAVDPLLASANTANPQTFNRYAYVLNNPLTLIDRTGAFPEFTFSVYVRAFAPFAWFGPGNVARGDNRGFSTDPGASYRIQASSEVTAANDGRYFPMSITRAAPPTTSETNLGLFSWTAQSECYINDPAGNYYATDLPGGNDSLGYQMYGNDDAIPGSSDIDLNPQFRINYDDRGNGVVNMSVTGSVTGDQFPAAEAFIRDSSGNSVMLGVFAPAASSGPVGMLPGNNTRPMIDVNVTVQVNNGVFKGVVENGNVISLDEYNRRFTSQAPVIPNQ